MARRRVHIPLQVCLNGRKVGTLRREASGAIDFRYDGDWLGWPEAIPVSLSLPLREDRYIGEPVIAVFDNLLPDNDDIRRRLAERTKAAGRTPIASFPQSAATASGHCNSCQRARSQVEQGPCLGGRSARRRLPAFSPICTRAHLARARIGKSAFRWRARRRKPRCFTGKSAGTYRTVAQRQRISSSRKSASCRTAST